MPFVVLAQVIIFHSVPPRAPGTRARPALRSLLVPTGVGCYLLVGNGVAGWTALMAAGIGFRSLMPPGVPALTKVPPAATMALLAACVGATGVAGAAHAPWAVGAACWLIGGVLVSSAGHGTGPGNFVVAYLLLAAALAASAVAAYRWADQPPKRATTR